GCCYCLQLMPTVLRLRLLSCAFSRHAKYRYESTRWSWSAQALGGDARAVGEGGPKGLISLALSCNAGLAGDIRQKRPTLPSATAADPRGSVRSRRRLTLTYVGGIERGKRNPSLMIMARIADALKVPLVKLLNE